MIQQKYNKKRLPYQKISKGRLESILMLLGDYEGKTILDIGCGGGVLAGELKKRKNCTVYGIDVSPDAIEIAQKHLDKGYVLDVTEESLPKEIIEEVDVVVISEVLEHVFEPSSVMKKIKQELNVPVIVTVPNIFFWKQRVKILTGHFRYSLEGLMDWGHIRFFTYDTLKEMFGVSGYQIAEECHVIPTRLLKYIGKLFPTLCARQFAVRVEPVDVVVYTAIFGNYDQLAPVREEKGVVFVCITDNDSYQVSGWNMWYMQPMFDDITRNARYCKVNPHILFPYIEKSIWIDGNISVKKSVTEAAAKYIKDIDMSVYDHGHTKGDARTSVYKEADVLITSGKKDDPEIVRSQINRYKKEGYLDDQGLISSMIMYRKHISPNIIKGMDRWWSEIEEGSKRDQLSFNYAMWKEHVAFSYIQEDSRDNAYFKHVPHKKSNI